MPRKRDPSKVPKGHKKNLETIKRAAENGALGLMQLKVAGEERYVTALMAFAPDGEEIIMTPLAQLFDGNPYELFEAP